MEGSPHITEDEVMEYSHWDAVETDDDDDRYYYFKPISTFNAEQEFYTFYFINKNLIT